MRFTLKPFWLTIFYFVLYLGLLIITQSFYPVLPVHSEITLLNTVVLRILGSFCYYGDVSTFWLVCGGSTLLSLGVIFLGYYLHISSLRSLFSQIIVIESLVIYFFWIISNQIIPISGDRKLTLPNEFALYSILYVFSQLMIHGSVLIVLTKISSKRDLNASKDLLNQVVFECPTCKTRFHSQVLYCTKCHQNITVTQITTPLLPLKE